MSINKILIADDEPTMRGFLKTTLLRNGFEVEVAENGLVAIELLRKNHFDLVITDMKMPYKTGSDVLKFAKELDPNIVVIIMTAYGSIESAVDTIKQGAFNYIIKPFPPEVIETLIIKAKEQQKLIKENEYLREQSISKFPLVAESPAMKKILNDVEKIALCDASIFITGESGTGKEVLSHTIHYLSNRAKNSFIKVNCAAIPEALIESEFFGHEKGSFTGADLKKMGRFELADKGTLLLDEVTEIPIALQPKLLRAVQELEFERVGGIKPIKVNIRFISTSNRNMKEAIKSSIFREDLFFRLNVIPIHIPPLRERKEDIIFLANSFLKHFCQKNRKIQKNFAPSAIEKLLNYSWPGNVRELANIIERTVVLDVDSNIESSHLNIDCMEKCKIEEPNFEFSTLSAMEKLLILKTLKAQNNNKNKTAEVLGISIRTLRNKLKEYELKKESSFS